LIRTNFPGQNADYHSKGGFSNPTLKQGRIMREERRKKLEAKLRQMIAAHEESKNDYRRAKDTPPGTRVIRRRKGSVDKHIM